MKMILPAFIGLLALPATAAIYHVDFESGNDNKDGLTPAHAFKYAPGDPSATGQAAAALPQPGDTILFKGGVVYRGSVLVKISGAPGKPIVFDGNTSGKWGSGPAIIDGGKALDGWKKCASASDAKGLLRSAIDSDDPVLTFEAVPLWGLKEEVDDAEYRIPLGVARTRRVGSDVTVVAISGCVPMALKVAEELAEEGLSCEVIDPRTLAPLDTRTIVDSVLKTGRLVVTEPAHRTCGAAAEIAAVVAEKAQGALRAPIRRVCALDMQVPFSPALEPLIYPTPERIRTAIEAVCGVGETSIMNRRIG
jgi:hypothetical protein